MKTQLITAFQRLAIIASMSFTATVHAQHADLLQTPESTKKNAI